MGEGVICSTLPFDVVTASGCVEVGIFHVNFIFHPTFVGWNLGIITRKLQFCLSFPVLGWGSKTQTACPTFITWASHMANTMPMG